MSSGSAGYQSSGIRVATKACTNVKSDNLTGIHLEPLPSVNVCSPQRKTTIYYNLGLFFTALAIGHISYANTVLSKVIVEISQCGCFTNKIGPMGHRAGVVRQLQRCEQTFRFVKCIWKRKWRRNFPLLHIQSSLQTDFLLVHKHFSCVVIDYY